MGRDDKVVETAIVPEINTGIAHSQAGVGQIGAIELLLDAVEAAPGGRAPERQRIARQYSNSLRSVIPATPVWKRYQLAFLTILSHICCHMRFQSCTGWPW